MRRKPIVGVLSLCGIGLLAAPVAADVIVRGPFGRAIVVASPVDVRVGPGVSVVAPGGPAPVAPGTTTVVRAPFTTVIVSKPAPVIRPAADPNELPPPRVLPGDAAPGGGVPPAAQPVAPTPVTPADFVRNFQWTPGGGTYNVLFLHPINRKAVEVAFNLPPGNPRVTYHGNSLLFDYGRGHDVEVRFQAGGKVRVTQR